MQLDVMITYRLHLTPEEFSTLGKSLAESNDPKAKELNVAIQRLRHHQAKQTLERTEHVLKSAEEAQDE
jgi:hypothetical protein